MKSCRGKRHSQNLRNVTLSRQNFNRNSSDQRYALTCSLLTPLTFILDLAHRRQSSSNEAEFRAYLIYLNLNDTKKALKHLGAVPTHLKTDPYIVRARSVLNAYIAENYSKFFRVVRQATQLEGSVLFRYFNKECFLVFLWQL